jgi:small subunit ribosomal protein S4
MGDPKFAKKLYETPNHPWQTARIKEENDIVKKYGLKNKTEVWKARSRLRQIRGQARDLQGKQRIANAQITRETQGLLGRLQRMGMVSEGATLADILALNVEAVLMRRLQTMAYLKGLAATPNQARQLIVHGHVSINGRRVDVPSYHVMKHEEIAIEYTPSSPLTNADHPVRPNVSEGGNILMELAPVDTGRQKPAGRGRGPNAGGGREQRAARGETGGFGRGGFGGGRGGFRGGPGGGSRGRGTGAPGGARRPAPGGAGGASAEGGSGSSEGGAQ